MMHRSCSSSMYTSSDIGTCQNQEIFSQNPCSIFLFVHYLITSFYDLRRWSISNHHSIQAFTKQAYLLDNDRNQLTDHACISLLTSWWPQNSRVDAWYLGLHHSVWILQMIYCSTHTLTNHIIYMQDIREVESRLILRF